MKNNTLHQGIVFIVIAIVALVLLISFGSCDVQAQEVEYRLNWIIYMNDGLDSLQEKPVDRWCLFVFDVADTTIAPFEDPALFDSTRLITPPHLLYPDYLYRWYNHDSLYAVAADDTTISGMTYKHAHDTYISPEDGRYLAMYVFAYAADGDYSTGVGTLWEKKNDIRTVRPASSAWISRN